MEFQLLHEMNEASAELVRTPGKSGDLTSLLHHIAQTARMTFGADSCMIIAINPITGTVIDSQTLVGNVQIKNEKSYNDLIVDEITQWILRERIMSIQNLDEQPEYHSHFTRNEGMHSVAGFAMYTRHRQRPLGTICLNYRQPRTFSSADYESFRNFAGQAALLLQETWLARHYETIARIGQEVNHDLGSIDNLFLILQKYVDTVLDESHTLVLAVYQPQTNTLNVHLKEHGQTVFLHGSRQEAYHYTMGTQQSWFIRHLSEEARFLPFQHISFEGAEPKESIIFVPVMLRGISLGVLSVQHPSPNAYGQEDQFILQLLASYIALALHNMRLYSSLSQLNETGQILTQQLESEQTLQATVDKIQAATQADVAILYPCESPHQRFTLPPRVAGKLLNSRIDAGLTGSLSSPEDIAALMLVHKKPIFAKESTAIYAELHSNRSLRRGSFQEREQIRSMAALPLLVEDELVGILFINFRQSQRFDAIQKLSIEGLAHYAAIAIKNSHAFGRLTQRRLRELEILQWIDRALSQNLDLQAVLSTLLRMAREQVPAEEVSILLYNAETQRLETAAAIGRHAEMSRQQTISLQENKGITRWVVEHKKSVRVTNIRQEPLWRDLQVPVASDIISELDVPLLDGEEIVGVLNFESTREGAFRQEDEDFLLTLAGQAVLAIKNAQTYEREKRLVAEGRVLNEISKEITSQLDPVRVFDLILEKAQELTHSTVASLHLYDVHLNELVMVVERGVARDRKGQHQRLNEGLVGYVAAHKDLLNVGDVTQSPWNRIYLELSPGTLSELAMPMLAGHELRGVLNLESPRRDHFDDSSERLIKGLAGLAVVALQNAERYEKARIEAQRFELLYQAGEELSKITDLSQLEYAYDAVLRIAEEESRSLVLIRRYHEDTQELEVVRISRVLDAAFLSRKAVSSGVNGQVAREQRTIMVPDIQNPPLGVAIPQPSDPATRSLLVTPIVFKEVYYGNLGLNHQEVAHFQKADVLFFEGLARQLASTIFRLETAQARQEFEQRLVAAEEMSSIGQSAFEVTHRLDNDLGLVDMYVTDIRSELEKLGVANAQISKKLANIVLSARTALSFSSDIKQNLARWKAREETAGEPEVLLPGFLLETAAAVPSLPSIVQIKLQVDEDVAAVFAIRSLVADILRNLVTNALQAMPDGGQITLYARNVGRSVALSVIDTGIGIPVEKISKVFDLFFSTKGSSGFGLWSARQNALRNRGDLKVESEPGKGTTFTLFLPRNDLKTP